MPILVIKVPHLGGIDAAYQLAHEYDPQKPTIVLVHSFMASHDLYRSQFVNTDLTAVANLVAIDLLGHGATRTESETFTYWDMAIMNNQVMEALKIDKYFVLGTSQGGWITARMALLAPHRVQGIILLGTSMDSESDRSRALGCWDVHPIGTALIDGWTSKDPTPDFEIDEGFCNTLVDLGLGEECEKALRERMVAAAKENYSGDGGRRRARMASINLRDRDGLYGRVFDIKCPVLWMHGSDDKVYSTANAEEEIKLFANSPDAKLSIVQGGKHFLSASHPKEIDSAVLEFVKKWSEIRPTGITRGKI